MATDKAPIVFISYSWDDPSHEQWVLNLANQLRLKGIDATIDKFKTQQKTVNLNIMMVQEMRKSDYVIVVLTEKYALRADGLMGGVGFETTLSLADLKRSPEKFIFVVRHNGSFGDAFPFHLRDFHAIDFSNENEFKEKLDELVRRIYGEPSYYQAPLGPRPTFEAPPQDGKPSLRFANLDVTVPKHYTDQDKEQFMEHSFQQLCGAFHELFSYIHNSNAQITFRENKNDTQYGVKVFLGGELKTGLKMWKDQLGFAPTINLSYGLHHTSGSYNECLRCEEETNELKLKMTMNLYGDNPRDIDEMVTQIWRRHLEPMIKFR